MNALITVLAVIGCLMLALFAMVAMYLAGANRLWSAIHSPWPDDQMVERIRDGHFHGVRWEHHLRHGLIFFVLALVLAGVVGFRIT